MSGTKCGFFKSEGRSDHVPWYQHGFPATLASEPGSFLKNPYYHTESDTYQNIDIKYMSDFAKMAVVYLSELAKGSCWE